MLVIVLPDIIFERSYRLYFHISYFIFVFRYKIDNMVDVATARRKLLEALGDCGEKYWTNMKLWYKQKINKDDFDTQAFELLGPGKINYHNEFILAILAKCQAVAASNPQQSTHTKLAASAGKNVKSVHLRKPRVKRPCSKTSALVEDFVIPDAMEQAPVFVGRREDTEIALCSQDLVLPDIPTLHGRLYLGAWDVGLDSVDDQAVPLLAASMEAFLKNILTLCVSRRKSYKNRSGTHFQHAFGAADTRSTIQGQHLFTRTKSAPRTAGQAEAEAYTRLGGGQVCSTVLPPISLFSLRDAVQECKHVIPSHAIRAVNMERIINDMWHPGHDEIQQNELFILETQKLHEKLKHQRGLRV